MSASNEGVDFLFFFIFGHRAMISLKTYSPVLAQLLSTTPDILYERQRRLTRAGLVEVASGRGPGSGIRVSPRSVTAIVLASLATDGLQDLETLVPRLTHLPIRKAKRCPLTDASTFGDAIIAIFTSPAYAAKVRSVSVHRPAEQASISFENSSKYGGVSDFGHRIAVASGGLSVVASLSGKEIRSVSVDIADIIAGKKPASMQLKPIS